jgi:hypothetical protein
MALCNRCDDVYWVCEAHSDRPSDLGQSPRACKCDFGLALVGFLLLVMWELPPLVVVAISAVGGIALALAA